MRSCLTCFLLTIFVGLVAATTGGKPIDVFATYDTSRAGEHAQTEADTIGALISDALFKQRLLESFEPGVALPTAQVPTSMGGKLTVAGKLKYSSSTTVLTVEFSENSTGALLYDLANEETQQAQALRGSPVDSALPETNLIQSLNITSAQLGKPIVWVKERTVPVAVLVVLSLVLGLFVGIVVGCAVRKKALKSQRSINFSDLIAIELEMQTQCERQLSQSMQPVHTPGPGDVVL